jgi:parvulin-like peptidyl-prolyl isomerase
MVREELFVQRGLELDMPGTDPDTRAAMVAAVEQQVVVSITTQMPADAELRRFFATHQSNYSSEGVMRLRHLLVAGIASPDDMDRARRAVIALREGLGVDLVAASYGLKAVIPEHAGPDEFYFAARIHLGEQLFSLALQLDDGDVTDPVATTDGIHILQMLRNTRPVLRNFDEARGEVLNDYTSIAKKTLADADARYLRDKANILIADDYADAYQSLRKKDEAARRVLKPTSPTP